MHDCFVLVYVNINCVFDVGCWGAKYSRVAVIVIRWHVHVQLQIQLRVHKAGPLHGSRWQGWVHSFKLAPLCPVSSKCWVGTAEHFSCSTWPQIISKMLSWLTTLTMDPTTGQRRRWLGLSIIYPIVKINNRLESGCSDIFLIEGRSVTLEDIEIPVWIKQNSCYRIQLNTVYKFHIIARFAFAYLCPHAHWKSHSLDKLAFSHTSCSRN